MLGAGGQWELVGSYEYGSFGTRRYFLYLSLGDQDACEKASNSKAMNYTAGSCVLLDQRQAWRAAADHHDEAC